MLNEIKQFSSVRVEARAFLTYLLTRNIPNHLPDITLDTIVAAFKKIKKPLHSSDLVRLIEPCGPLHDGEPKLYDRCSCSYAYGIRVRVHDGASLVGMYASCVFTSLPVHS